MSVFGVFLVRIQSQCGKIRTIKTPKTDTFHAVPISCQRSNLFQCFPLFCNVSHAITRICCITKDILKNFSKFTGKHLCLRLSGLKPATSWKKRLQSRNFPANFEKFLRKHFFEEHVRVIILAFPGKGLRQMRTFANVLMDTQKQHFF